MPTSAGGKGAARAATQAQAFPLLWASVSAQTSRRPPFAERGPRPGTARQRAPRAPRQTSPSTSPRLRARRQARGRERDAVSALVSEGFLAQPATVRGRFRPPAARGTLGIRVPGRAPFTTRPRPRRPLADARRPGQRDGRGRHVTFGRRLRPTHRPSCQERTECARQLPGLR